MKPYSSKTQTLLFHLIDKWKYWKDKGRNCFYESATEIKKKTGISKRHQQNILNQLHNDKIIYVTQRGHGLPPLIHFTHRQFFADKPNIYPLQDIHNNSPNYNSLQNYNPKNPPAENAGDRDNFKNNPKAKMLLAYWNSKAPLLPKHSKGTNRYLKIMNALNYYLGLYSRRTIEYRIDIYCELLQETDLENRLKETGVRVGLDDWFEFSSYCKPPRLKFKSWFLRLGENKSLLVEEFMSKKKKRDFLLLENLRFKWKEHKGGEPSTADERNFIIAVDKLKDFVKKHRSNILFKKNRPPGIMAAYLVEAVKKSTKHNIPHSGYLTTPMAYDSLITYLKDNYLWRQNYNTRERIRELKQKKRDRIEKEKQLKEMEQENRKLKRINKKVKRTLKRISRT